MFGNKKNKLVEQIRETFSEILTRKNTFETGMNQLEEGEQQIHTELCQVIENTGSITEHAMLNLEEESALLHCIDDFSKDLGDAVNGYDQLKNAVSEQMRDITNLVEENKHYTSPAKYLTEASVVLKQSCKSYETRLEALAESISKMGNPTLSTEILSLKDEMTGSCQKMEEFEDVIHRLVALIKDGNIATTRLLKKCRETEKLMQNVTMCDFSDDMLFMRDKVVGMRNLDEEIVKCGDRNKIQLNDIQEDILHQKRELTELESDFAYLFDKIEEQLK